MIETITTCDKCGYVQSTKNENGEQRKFTEVSIHVTNEYRYSYDPATKPKLTALWCHNCMVSEGFVRDESLPPPPVQISPSEQIARLIGEIAGEAGAEAAINTIQNR